jgi:serpin B
MPRRHLASLVANAGLVGLAALVGVTAPAGAEAPAPPSPAVLALAKGHNAFAVALYGQLRGAGGNLVFSPYSIHSALAMTRAGARGETAAQMDRVLHLPPGADEAWRGMVAHVTHAPKVEGWDGKARTLEEAYSLSVANALFGQKGYAFVPAYRTLLTSAYGAELLDVDFHQAEATRTRINDWVLSKTRDKIKDLIPAGLPTPDTRLAIVNAIHFYGPWEEPFTPSATQKKPFTNEKGEPVPVEMMRRTDTFRYVEDGDARSRA